MNDDIIRLKKICSHLEFQSVVVVKASITLCPPTPGILQIESVNGGAEN